MMQNSVMAADKDVVEVSPEAKETTSEQLFNHLFGACNILR
jgi:type I restriction enzyme M protein